MNAEIIKPALKDNCKYPLIKRLRYEIHTPPSYRSLEPDNWYKSVFQTDEKFQRLQSQASQLSGDNEQLTSDLTKANEILHRKIDEIKQIKEKYKRNAEIIKRQEEILNQKDQDLKVGEKFFIKFFD